MKDQSRSQSPRYPCQRGYQSVLRTLALSLSGQELYCFDAETSEPYSSVEICSFPEDALQYRVERCEILELRFSTFVILCIPYAPVYPCKLLHMCTPPIPLYTPVHSCIPLNIVGIVVILCCGLP